MNSTLPILAVDLGQFNSVLGWFHTNTGELRFRTVRTTPDDLRRVLTREAASRRRTGATGEPARRPAASGDFESARGSEAYARSPTPGGDAGRLE